MSERIHEARLENRHPDQSAHNGRSTCPSANGSHGVSVMNVFAPPETGARSSPSTQAMKPARSAWWRRTACSLLLLVVSLLPACGAESASTSSSSTAADSDAIEETWSSKWCGASLDYIDRLDELESLRDEGDWLGAYEGVATAHAAYAREIDDLGDPPFDEAPSWHRFRESMDQTTAELEAIQEEVESMTDEEIAAQPFSNHPAAPIVEMALRQIFAFSMSAEVGASGLAERGASSPPTVGSAACIEVSQRLMGI